MNIVNSGTSYKIFDESVLTSNILPAKCFKVEFNDMAGFSLRSQKNLDTIEEKIYGNTEYNVNKVLKSFALTDRNLGVILSGDKGVGKSLFAKVLGKQANSQGLPLILVDANNKGLADFISSIDQECVVLFDEFEKNFPCDYDYDPIDDTELGADGGAQNNLLSLFDGLDSGKKLFVITCNDTYKLSNFFLNRPGRFHYHFEIQPPTTEEIREYLKDKLDVKYYNVIDKVIQLSYYGNITYDCLRALAFEINQGYEFSEIINSLNLVRDNKLYLNIEVVLSNHDRFNTREWVNLASNQMANYWLYSDASNSEIKIAFKPINITCLEDNLTIDKKDVILKTVEYSDKEVTTKNVSINSINITKVNDYGNYRYIV